MKPYILAVFIAGAIGLTLGYWGSIIFPNVDRESVYACRDTTVTTTTVMPNAAPAVETHAGYPDCKKVR